MDHDDLNFNDLTRLLKAEVEMARAHLDAWDEADAAWDELVEAGALWGSRLADAIESLTTFNEWAATYPTEKWWELPGA